MPMKRKNDLRPMYYRAYVEGTTWWGTKDAQYLLGGRNSRRKILSTKTSGAAGS